MLSRKTMALIGAALGPVTVVILDALLVGPGGSNELVQTVRTSEATAILAWIAGLFLGHWFHPGASSEPRLGLPGPPWNLAVLAGVTLFLGGLLLSGAVDAGAASDWLPATLAAAGFGGASLLWPV